MVIVFSISRLAGLPLLFISGCATVFGGTSQEITINTNPAGATCVFARQGVAIGSIQSTPAILTVQRRKFDIMITCDKPGYQTATYLNRSGLSGAVAGNVAADLILTAGLSSIVDSADGADNQYDGAVNMTLAPVLAAAASVKLTPIPATALQPDPSTMVNDRVE